MHSNAAEDLEDKSGSGRSVLKSHEFRRITIKEMDDLELMRHIRMDWSEPIVAVCPSDLDCSHFE